MIRNWVSTNLNLLEVCGLALFVAGTTFHIDMLKTIGLLSLASIYLIMSGATFPASIVGKIALRIAWLSWAICAVGILFVLLHWPGAMEMMMTGAILSAIATPVIYVVFRNERFPEILRGGLITLLTAAVYYIYFLA